MLEIRVNPTFLAESSHLTVDTGLTDIFMQHSFTNPILFALQCRQHSSHGCKKTLFFFSFDEVYFLGCDFVLVLSLLLFSFITLCTICTVYTRYASYYRGSVSDCLGPSAFNR